MELDSKRIFDGMKESLGPDFIEELKKELEETNAKVVFLKGYKGWTNQLRLSNLFFGTFPQNALFLCTYNDLTL